jgi:rod shape-determining protein MreD
VALFQSSVLPLFPIFGVVPNVVLLIVMGWSFHNGPNAGMVWALIGGLLVDLTSGTPLGLSVLPFIVAVLIASVGYARVYRANLILPALITLAALVTCQVLYLLLSAAVGRPVLWGQVLGEVVFPWLLFHMVVMPGFYFAAAWLSDLVGSRDLNFGA